MSLREFQQTPAAFPAGSFTHAGWTDGRLFRNPLKFRDYPSLGLRDAAAGAASRHTSPTVAMVPMQERQDVRVFKTVARIQEVMEGWNNERME